MIRVHSNIDKKNGLIDSKMKVLGYIKEYDNILGDPELKRYAVHYWKQYNEEESRNPDIYHTIKRIEIAFFQDHIDIDSFFRNYNYEQDYPAILPAPLTEEEMKLILQKIKYTKKRLKKHFA